MMNKKRITKIDYAPESETERYDEYVYKGNKLKIFYNTSTARDCNETMEFNDAAQLIKRQIFFSTRNGWVKNNYAFTYNEKGLVAVETKKKDGNLYTVATHYYY